MTRFVLAFLQAVAIIQILCGLPMMLESFLVGVACSGLGLILTGVCCNGFLLDEVIDELRKPPTVRQPPRQ